MYTRHTDYYYQRRLRLDTRRRKIGGVCAGLARYLEIGPGCVRVAAIIALFVFPQVTLLAYGVAWLVLDDA